jgi:hypothetical protein
MKMHMTLLKSFSYLISGSILGRSKSSHLGTSEKRVANGEVITLMALPYYCALDKMLRPIQTVSST